MPLTPKSWDATHDLIIPGNYEITMTFSTQHFVKVASRAIDKKGSFHVALSGGSTPQALYQKLTAPPFAHQIEWSKVHLFWSDERAVPPTDPDSNYKMSMDAGFSFLPIPSSQIHRMVAEKQIDENAKAYEELIKKEVKNTSFDLIMLGMGEDGHTASLMPGTEGLKETRRLVIPNYIPQKSQWRMSFTFPLINQAENIVIYVLGAQKKHRLAEALKDPNSHLPIQCAGTKDHKALFIVDSAAAAELN